MAQSGCSQWRTLPRRGCGVRLGRLTTLGLSWLALILAAVTALAADETTTWVWRQAGYGGGGRFTAAAFDPRDPSTVYVGSDVAGFFRSRDQGATFVPLGHDLTNANVAAILPDPEGQRLFVLTEDALAVSRDQGEHFATISRELRYTSPDPGTDLLLPTGDGGLFVATSADGVFRVEPSGDGWSVTPLGLAGVKVNGLARLHDRLFAATNQGVRRLSLGLFHPMDQGLPLFGPDITDITVQADQLFCLEKHQGLYVLAGTTWESRGPQAAGLPSNGTPAYKNLGPNPAKPGNLFVTTHPKSWPHLLVSTDDAGAHWAIITHFALTDGPPNWASGLESPERIVFSRDGRLGLLTDWWNVWRSFNGGHDWLQCHKGLQNTVVNDIAVSPDDPRRLYLAVADNGLMRSDDGGATWRRSMANVVDGHATAVALAPGHPNIVYLLLDPWTSQNTKELARFFLYRSDDGGTTWRRFRFSDKRRPRPADFVSGAPSALAVDPRQPDRVFVAVNGYGIYVLNTASPPPPDGDAPARNIGTGIATPYFKTASSLLLDAEHPDTLYAATQQGGVWKTSDAGATWRQLPGTQGFVFGLALDPADHRHLLAAAAEKTLLETRNAGNSWTVLRLPGDRPSWIPASAVLFGPPGSNLVFAGTAAFDNKVADGLFVSRDGGKHFQTAPAPMVRAGINALANTPAVPGGALVGLGGLGLYAVAPAP